MGIAACCGVWCDSLLRLDTELGDRAERSMIYVIFKDVHVVC